MKMFEKNGAAMSDDRKYRYALWRIWDVEKRKVMFIGLNPSTANEISDDPTIRRVIRFAYDWGFGGVYMLNCFPLVSANPDDLKGVYQKSTTNIFEIQNHQYLIGYATECEKVVFAWGSFPIVKEFDIDIKLRMMFPEAYCLGKNANGSPKHPLYLRRDSELVKFSL